MHFIISLNVALSMATKCSLILPNVLKKACPLEYDDVIRECHGRRWQHVVGEMWFMARNSLYFQRPIFMQDLTFNCDVFSYPSDTFIISLLNRRLRCVQISSWQKDLVKL